MNSEYVSLLHRQTSRLWLEIQYAENTQLAAMSDDRVILLTNRGDGVDEVPNDEEDYEATGIELNVSIPFAAYNKIGSYNLKIITIVC